LSDKLRDLLGPSVVFLAGTEGQKASLVCSCTPDMADKGFHCGNFLKSVAQAVGSSGGGRPNLAQGGIKDAARAGEAIEFARGNIESVLSGLSL